MKTKTNYRRATIQYRQSKIQNSKVDADLTKKVALSCQILAKLGQFKETTGHVSARSADGKNMWIRGRGKQESGLLFTKPSEVVLADFNGQKLNPKIVLKTPNESVIHGEIYKARPDVGGIVHAHPPSIVLASQAGIELRPIYGGYDPRGMRMAIKGIPVYQSSLTLHKVEHVREMMAVMADNDICILRGHGVVVCGSSVEDATIKAIKLDDLAKFNLQAALLGKVPAISPEDQHQFLTRKSTGMGGGGAETLWRFYTEWLKRT
ncbi:MAG: class II aldolase/adducin family protein [Deltaproteobacteria bacterium]|nr:class II aldolase/adducin family protein [Deltaproteobacteria bacterium]